MTKLDFDMQMNRLTSTYGPKAYPDERKRILWGEFNRMDASVFEAVVSRLIGENTTPPMLPRFREIAATLREKSWTSEKRQNEIDAKNAMSRFSYAPESYCSFEQYVVDLIEKEIHTEDFKRAVKVFGLEKLERVYEAAKKKDGNK